MSEDIAGNIEIFPIVVGIVISVICILIDFLTGSGFFTLPGLLIGSAAAGFLCKNSTVYAVIYGAVILIIDILFIGIVFGLMPPFLFYYIILGIFGAFIGKIIQSRVV